MSPPDPSVPHGPLLPRRTVLGGALAVLAAACAGRTPLTTDNTTPTSLAEVPGPTEPTAVAKPTPSAVPASPAATSDTTIASAILGRPTDGSVTVNALTTAPADLFVEYGTKPGSYSQRTEAQPVLPKTPIEATIGSLAPGTRYYYRLRHGDAAGPEGSFVTQRPPGQPFTFAIQGDSHPERVGRQFDATLYEKTLRSAASANPDFYICIGDDFSVDALKQVNPDVVRSLYVRQRQWLGLVGAPVFLVNGNHEQASKANLNGTADNVAVWAQTSRNSLFPQPAPDDFYGGNPEPVEFIGLLRNYFSFTWGDALFVVIDPYWHSPQTVDNQFGADREEKRKRDLWNVTLGETQYRWFEKTLRTSTAKHKLVFSHHVNGTGRGGVELAKTFEWGDAAQFAIRRPGWGKPIHQLMVDNKVGVFFQGHDHIFVHQELDGVVYQTLPNPANPNYTLENEASYLSGVKIANSGHVRVEVTPDEVTVSYIRSYLERDDEVAHTYHVS